MTTIYHYSGCSFCFKHNYWYQSAINAKGMTWIPVRRGAVPVVVREARNGMPSKFVTTTEAV